MEIDIDNLSEPELIELNHRVVARLNFLGEMRAHAAMLQFGIGEQVCFQPAGQAPVTGIVTRYNKKTVTVVTNDGRHWTVSPAFLSKLPRQDSNPTSSNLVPLRRP
jgi:hypothetical protein